MVKKIFAEKCFNLVKQKFKIFKSSRCNTSLFKQWNSNSLKNISKWNKVYVYFLFDIDKSEDTVIISTFFLKCCLPKSSSNYVKMNP